MDDKQKQEILVKFYNFFREVIVKNHIKNTKKLNRLKEFKYNPFLFKYLANFLSGNTDPENLARVLIYPRALQTSINTSFGSNVQKQATEIFKSVFGSAASGIDFEFIDQIDGRKKYCQVKLGPDTINSGDVETIIGHFGKVKNLARTNNLHVELSDLIVGVLYGTPRELNGNYRVIHKDYPVYVGKDFWVRLTGDEGFYRSLIDTFAKAAEETNGKRLLNKVVKDLAQDIQENFIEKELEE